MRPCGFLVPDLKDLHAWRERLTRKNRHELNKLSRPSLYSCPFTWLLVICLRVADLYTLITNSEFDRSSRLFHLTLIRTERSLQMPSKTSIGILQF